MKALLLIALVSCSKEIPAPSRPLITADEAQKILSLPRESTEIASVGDAWTITSDEKKAGFFVELPSGEPFPFKLYENELGYTYSWFPEQAGTYNIAYVKRNADGSLDLNKSYRIAIIVRYHHKLPATLTG